MHRLVAWLLFIGLFALPAAAGVEVYTVKPGDTIYAVARELEGPSQGNNSVKQPR